MKKGGILNVELMKELTALRHTDSIAIVDAGLSIPSSCKIIDLSLVKGIPSFADTIRAVLYEIIVEKYLYFEPMSSYNPEMLQTIRSLMPKQKEEALPLVPFWEEVKKTKAVIRTAEFGSCCNIILYSASGLQKYVDQFNI